MSTRSAYESSGLAPRAPEISGLLGVARAAFEELGAAAVTGFGEPGAPASEAAAPDDVGRFGAGDAGAALVDLIASMEDLTAAAAAVQARAAVELDRVRREQEAEQGVAAARRGRGVAAEVGLAARISGSRGSRLLGFGKVLCLEMPHTLAGLAAGRLSPWRATLLVKESACLPVEDRARLDEDLCADEHVLAGLGDRQVGDAARTWCARENAAAVVARRAKAESERRVSLRPAPDTMVYLTALLPVASGVAAYAALTRRADAVRAQGAATAGGEESQPRTRGQVMADALVAAVTGQPEGACPPMLVNLVMTDTALFSGGSEPGIVPGYGPVPAAAARELVVESNRGAGAWVRRLYMAPSTGALVAMDSRRRRAPQGLSDLLNVRDGDRCRIAWCDAPARHDDHVTGLVNSAATSERDQQRTCEAHNYGKAAPGWRSTPKERAGPDEPDGLVGPGGRAELGRWADVSESDGTDAPGESRRRHRVVTTTPTGHRYASTAPPLPGSTSTGASRRAEPEGEVVQLSVGERALVDLNWARSA